MNSRNPSNGLSGEPGLSTSKSGKDIKIKNRLKKTEETKINIIPLECFVEY